MKITVIALLLALIVMDGVASAACTLPASASSKAQIARGSAVFASSCASCHGEKLEGTFAPSLSDAAFKAKWSDKSVGDLNGFIASMMPPGEPGSLPNGQYHDVTAFILSANGNAVGEKDIDNSAAALAQCATTK